MGKATTLLLLIGPLLAFSPTNEGDHIADIAQCRAEVRADQGQSRVTCGPRPAYWMPAFEISRTVLSNLPAGGDPPRIDNLLSAYDKNMIMQIDAGTNMIRNNPQTIPYLDP